MKIHKTGCLWLCFFMGNLLAADRVDCGKVPCNASAPAFSQYPISSIYKEKPARLVYKNNRLAKKYRTVLTQDTRGADFAGHYKLVDWGCGTECIQVTIVDVRNGRVYFPPSIRFVDFSRLIREEPTPSILQYEINSSLLYVLGSCAGGPCVRGFNWSANKLVPVYTENHIWGND